jgi:hypothetical protein
MDSSLLAELAQCAQCAWLAWLAIRCARLYLQVGLVVFPSAGSSVHLAMAQTVASRPIMKTPRRAQRL